jgi:hypothetical protein
MLWIGYRRQTPVSQFWVISNEQLPAEIQRAGFVVGRASLDLATLGLKVAPELQIVSME